MADIAVNLESYKELKKAYDQAVKDGLDQFVFKGNHLLVSYCKYLLEHMRNLLNIKEK